MAVIRNLVVKINADISGLKKGLKQAEYSMKRVGGSLSKIGGLMSLGITAPLSAMVGMITKTSMQFEQSMANAASVSGATADELERMSELAREMGKTTVFSASDAADAMYYMASAGYKVEQMAASIEPILSLAAATQSDLAFSTDTVISTLNQFSLDASDASRVTNVFASVIGNSQATLDKLSYSMRYVGPVANSLGYSLEETAACLGILYNAGFKGEQAGTILRGAMSRLLKPTSAINSVLAEMGLNYDDVNPSTNKFSDIIGKLEKAGITTAQAVGLFGQEAGPGMMAMIGKGEQALIDLEETITGTNAASDMAAKQLDTMQGASKLLQSQVEELSLKLGEILLPILNSLTLDYLSPLVDKLSNMSEETMVTVSKVVALAMAAGPLVLIIGKLISVVGSLSGFIAGLSLSSVALFGVIALVAFGIAKAFKESEEFRNSIKNLMQAIGVLIMAAVDPLVDIITTIAPTLADIAVGIAEVIGWIARAITAVITWLDQVRLLDFALALLGITLGIVAAVKLVAYIGSVWQAVTAMGAFIVSVGTSAILALKKFIMTISVMAILALGNFKLAITNVVVSLGAMAAAVGLAFYIFTNWDTMNGVQRVISIIGVLTVALLGAAMAFGVFHSAWSLGLAVAGIVAGVTAVIASVESARASIPDAESGSAGKTSAQATSSISGFANGGMPEKSTLFFANEYGNPELVANFGGGTGVANNEMIVSAIESAAYKGMARAMDEASRVDSEQVAVVNINGREFARATFSDIVAEGKRRGEW